MFTIVGHIRGGATSFKKGDEAALVQYFERLILAEQLTEKQARQSLERLAKAGKIALLTE